MTASIGNLRPAAEDTLTDAALDWLPPHAREIAGRVMVAIVTSMRGADAYWSTGDLAARLGIRPRTAERDALNSALTYLQRTRLPRLMHYEHGGPGAAVEWQLTPEGVEVARRLSTGISGATRRIAGEAPRPAG